MIKLNPAYSLRKVLDTYIVIGIGKDAYHPNQLLTLNETGAYLWNNLKQGMEKSSLIEHMITDYDVSKEIAEKDIEAFLSQLRAKKLIIED